MCYRVSEIQICRPPTAAARACLRAGLKVEGILRMGDVKDMVEFWGKRAKLLNGKWKLSQ